MKRPNKGMRLTKRGPEATLLLQRGNRAVAARDYQLEDPPKEATQAVSKGWKGTNRWVGSTLSGTRRTGCRPRPRLTSGLPGTCRTFERARVGQIFRQLSSLS